MNRQQAPKPSLRTPVGANAGQVRTIRDSRGRVLAVVNTQTQTTQVRRGGETVEFNQRGEVVKRG